MILDRGPDPRHFPIPRLPFGIVWKLGTPKSPGWWAFSLFKWPYHEVYTRYTLYSANHLRLSFVDQPGAVPLLPMPSFHRSWYHQCRWRPKRQKLPWAASRHWRSGRDCLWCLRMDLRLIRKFSFHLCSIYIYIIICIYNYNIYIYYIYIYIDVHICFLFFLAGLIWVASIPRLPRWNLPITYFLFLKGWHLCWGHQSLGTVGCLSLTLEAEDVTADELANVYGRTQKPSSKKLDPNACGDVGPVLGKALQLSIRLAEGSGRKVELCSIEVETSPVAVNSEIRLCACMDKGSDQSPAILVTGWLHGKDVLRFRAVFRPSVEWDLLEHTGQYFFSQGEPLLGFS